MLRRRDVLKWGAAATLAALHTRAFAAAREKPRRVGLIGTGWYGKCDLTRLLQVEPVEVVSLCDVDRRLLDEAGQLVAARQASGRQPRLYADYRQMLAEKDLDIVLVDTPDHWHALPMIAAVNAGADVFVQKPISVDVLEGAAMLDAARRQQRVVQVGMQRRSTPHLIEARDRVIREGLLGKVAHVETYCYYHMRANSNPQPMNPPEGFDYEMWTGPAPLRPYTELTHPRTWRAFMEYGNGIVGDMCVHMLDMVRWALDLGWPRRIASSGGILVQKDSLANITDTQHATFEFDGLNVVWTHRSWGAPPDPEYPWGATIYGDRGTLKLSVQKYEFIPQGRGTRLQGQAVLEFDKYPDDVTDREPLRLEQHVASAIRGHMRDFLQAIDSRGRPVSDIEQGYVSAACCILANLAMQLGRTLEFDPATRTVRGDDEATRLLRRPYRQPWQHPADG
ncbi:MAG: Gfo/Idh/MocA family oxidoreductase [Pirellulaceae bacterium]|nr:Gfo/Idh/MocA family oxidoreductase [Pirellulaceae bacterium]